MTIPDPVVYGGLALIITPLIGFSIWVARRFVKETVEQGPTGATGAIGAAGDQGQRGERGDRGDRGASMSINDFQQLGTLLKAELNGRYMFAPEARERFSAIERKLDHHAAGIKMFVQAKLEGHEATAPEK